MAVSKPVIPLLLDSFIFYATPSPQWGTINEKLGDRGFIRLFVARKNIHVKSSENGVI
jgi:hypothetical protein